MATIQDTVAFLLKRYPHKRELSNARVTKMVYLADWHQAINFGKQMTPINWLFDNYGPFVSEVKSTAESNPKLFKVELTANPYGTPKSLLSLNDENYSTNLTADEIQSLEHVIGATCRLNWDDFIKLVYSTYPIASSERYSHLDLRAKAAEYKQVLASQQK